MEGILAEAGQICERCRQPFKAGELAGKHETLGLMHTEICSLWRGDNPMSEGQKIVEQSMTIEIIEHTNITALTSYNADKRVIYINGNPVGTVNRNASGKWEASLLGGTKVKKSADSKADAVFAVLKMTLGASITEPELKLRKPVTRLPKDEVVKVAHKAASEAAAKERVARRYFGNSEPHTVIAPAKKANDDFVNPMDRLRDEVSEIGERK